MIKLKINSFKCGLFWYAFCEIPTEEHETYYYDNEPFVTIYFPVTLHCIGLTYESVNSKILNKLRLYFDERKNSNGSC